MSEDVVNLKKMVGKNSIVEEEKNMQRLFFLKWNYAHRIRNDTTSDFFKREMANLQKCNLTKLQELEEDNQNLKYEVYELNQK